MAATPAGCSRKSPSPTHSGATQSSPRICSAMADPTASAATWATWTKSPRPRSVSLKSVRDNEPYRGLPRYLFGESMGCAVTLLMYFQDPDGWDGLIFSAPLFIMPEPMKPSWWRLTAYGLLFGLADTWAVMPDNKMVKKAIKDPEKLKMIASNPMRYTGKPRVGTMRELCRVCAFFQESFEKVSAPFLTCHGTSDEVTAPESSTALYERAKSSDKTLKLYDDMYHSLIQGEPDDNAQIVLKDMREWLDARAEKLLASRAAS
ncbi:hypothetical protein KI387_030458 [Taxus chinensis]|uniref:Serine aminopeptidase S33 domain-containing protein n=1 Tax=Taxus chinensis TaxID=29808 RepID=A0AA38CBR6_TAXCH|nr:hypothetical protein KI387_030458 [Taxus chinensis]